MEKNIFTTGLAAEKKEKKIFIVTIFKPVEQSGGNV